MSEDRKSYWKRYYRKNKARILASKRSKYRTDEEYRARVRSAAQEKYAEERQEEGKEVVESFGESVRGFNVVKDTDGTLYFSMSYAVKYAGVHASTIRRWAKEGIIPPVKQLEEGKRWLWFTAPQLAILKQFSEYNRMTRAEKNSLMDYAEKHWNDDPKIEVI